MGRSSSLKRKGGNVVTKKMLAGRMEDMATLITVCEATLMEWEIWFRLIKIQKKSLTPEQFDFFLSDGPIFTDIPGKIMESIRKQMPQVNDDLQVETEKKPSILGADGLPVIQELPRILDSTGHTPNPLG